MALILLLSLFFGSTPVTAAVPLEPVPHPDVQGLEESVRGVLKAARDELEANLEARESIPEDPAGRRLWATLFGKLGALYHGFELEEAARVCYRNASVLDPADAKWLYLSGVLNQENRRLAEAERLYGQVLELLPEHLPTRLRLGEIYRLSGQIEAAEEVFRRVLESEGDERAGARAFAWLGLGRLATDWAGTATDRAGTATGREEPADAIELLQKAARLAPESGAVQQQLMLAYRRAGRLEEARRAASRVGPSLPIFDDPWGRAVVPVSGVTARIQLGNGQLRAGRPEAALRHHREARRLGPEDPAAARALALTLESLGQHQESLEHYAAAVRLAPDDPIYLYDEARARLRSTPGDPRAVAGLERVLELAPDYLNAHLLLASVRLDAGQTGAAEPSLKRALELSPQEPRALRALTGVRLATAERHLAAGETSEAIEALRSALELSPRDPLLRLDLTRLLLSDGRRAEASELLAEIRRTPPTSEALRLQWLELLPAAGREAEAAGLIEGWLLTAESSAFQQAAAAFFATAESEDLRDPRRAVELAQRAFEGRQTPEGAEIMALALASAGAFEAAIQWQERLLEQMSRVGAEDGFLLRLTANLERYRRSEPGSAPWASFLASTSDP